jgi:hypothetical protein
MLLWLVVNAPFALADKPQVVEGYQRVVRAGALVKSRVYSETLLLKNDHTFVYITWGKECSWASTEASGTWTRENDQLRLIPDTVGSIPVEVYLIHKRGVAIPTSTANRKQQRLKRIKRLRIHW